MPETTQECPECGSSIEVPSEKLGIISMCPACHRPIFLLKPTNAIDLVEMEFASPSIPTREKPKKVRLWQGVFLYLVVILGGLAAIIGAREDSPPVPSGRLVTRAEFGERWPFTVESGYVDCEGVYEAVFRVGDKTYAINGTARSWANRRGYLDITTSIWRDNPIGMGLKVNIGEMIDLALRECD